MKTFYYGCEPEEKMISFVVGEIRFEDADVRFGLSALGYELAWSRRQSSGIARIFTGRKKTCC